MITAGFCPTCHKPLPPDAPMGICPDCLLSAGFGTVTGDAETFSAFQPPSLDELAEHFPQLEILSLIGRGGMGAVYKARQKRLDRMVALKILPPGIGERAGFAERFEREARALAKLHHPHIVTLYEFGQTGRGGVHNAQVEQSGDEAAAAAPGLYYFLMEYVDGVNLRQLLSTGRVSPQEALAIVPQICEALQFAHDRGIVHRDIKPENILLNKEGRVKIADFGVAKIVSVAAAVPAAEARQQAADTAASTTDLTEAGKVMGTPSYMAPEQIAHPGAVDHRADIYALGVVFYQMLTGELPAKRIEAPSRKVHVDVRLDEVVLRALEKDPELRYQEASLFKTQVETIAGTPRPKSEDALRQSLAGGALLKSDRGRVTWEDDIGTTMFAPSTGTIELFADKLVFSSGAVRTEVPLDAVRTLQEAVPPAWWSPAGHRYLAVGHDADGRRRTVAFLAGVAHFRMVGETKHCAAEWLDAIQRAVKSATGREIEVLPGIQRLPLAVTPIAYLWLLLLIPVGISLFSTLMSAGRLSPGEALLANFFPVFAPLLIAAGVLIQRALSMDSGMIRAPETETEPRFSRAAIVGAGWAAFVPLHFLKPVWMEPAWRNSAFGGLLMGLAIFVALMAWSSVICTTVLGWTAVSQIRRSDGKLHGLWLAVFDGLLFPLLAVDAAVMLPVWSLSKLTPYQGPAPFWTLLAMGLAATALIIANVLLIRWIWRLVSSQPIVRGAMEAWLALMDGGDYAGSWDAAAPQFQRAMTREEWISRGEKTREPLGSVAKRRLVHTRCTQRGTRLEAEFRAEFASLPEATETVTFMRAPGEEWQATGYVIRPAENKMRGWKIAFWCILCALLMGLGINSFVKWRPGSWEPQRMTLSKDAVSEPFASIRVTGVTREGGVVVFSIKSDQGYPEHGLDPHYLDWGDDPTVMGPPPPVGGLTSLLLPARTHDQRFSNVAMGEKFVRGPGEFRFGFVLPDEQLAGMAVKQARDLYPGTRIPVGKGGSVLQLFNLKRRAGKDADGKAEWQLLTGQLSVSPLSAAPVATATFGPVVERYIPLPDTRGKGAPCVLDFETGELLLPPDKIRIRLAADRDSIGQPTYDWMRNSHGDAAAGIAELRLFEGWGYGVKANGSFLRFDEFTPDDVFKAMKDAVATQKQDAPGGRKPFVMTLRPERNAYAFITREGTMGVLEVQGQPGDGRTGMKIRYKLVQDGAAIPTSVPENPAFTARFAQGKIQLLAVSRITPASGNWWLPDGTASREPFEINWRHTESDGSIVALLLQKRDFPDGSAFFYKFAPDSCTLRGSSTPVTFHGSKLPGCEAVL